MRTQYLLVEYHESDGTFGRQNNIFHDEARARESLALAIRADRTKTYMVIDFKDRKALLRFIDRKPSGDPVQIMHEVNPIFIHWGNQANDNVFRRP